jgi:uncharacterized protein YukE
MRQSVTIAAIVVVGVLGAYAYRDTVRTFAVKAYHRVLPCRTPLTYSIGHIDTRFGMSESELREAAARAEKSWEEASERDLFAYRTSGGLVTIELVYDERQATTDTLEQIDTAIDLYSESYGALEARYESEKVAYDAASAAYDLAERTFASDVAAYEAEVQMWNERGGAPPRTYEELQRRSRALDARQKELVAVREQVNARADDVNALVRALNELASTLNAQADTYNETGGALDEEFEEAVFTSAPGAATIRVFEFDSTSRLTRVLAHEFGHALGLEHVADEDAIMYRLNEAINETPTAADIAELTRTCRFEVS